MPRDPIWLRPETSGVGRPPEHSRADVTQAALAVAEESGFAGVTMRKVAARLDTGAASLYRYVANRDELVLLMVESIYSRMELRRTGNGWRADIIEVAREGFRLSVAHPWFAEALVATMGSASPSGARLAEHCLSVLAEHPASGPAKMEFVGVMDGMVQQWASFVTRRDLAELMAAQAVYFAHVAQDGRHPHLAAAFAEPPGANGREDPVDTLARIVGMVLDGMLGPGGQPPAEPASGP